LFTPILEQASEVRFRLVSIDHRFVKTSMARLPIRIVFVIFALTAAGAVVLHNASFSRTITQNTDRKGGAIAGRVIDVEGRPVSNVIVSAERSDMIRPISTAYTNEHGEFVINGLPQGLYALYTRKEEDGYPRTDFNFYSLTDTDPQVAVHEHQPSDYITLRLGPTAARLVGRVIDANTNRPIPHADITVRRVDDPTRFLRTGLQLPVENGEFELLVPSMPFTIKVSEAGYLDWYYKVAGEERQTSALLLEPNSTKSLAIYLRPKTHRKK
jgi:hypothetical protein